MWGQAGLVNWSGDYTVLPAALSGRSIGQFNRVSRANFTYGFSMAFDSALGPSKRFRFSEND